MKKKILSLMLTLALCAGLVPAAFAAGGQQQEQAGLYHLWFYVEIAPVLE